MNRFRWTLFAVTTAGLACLAVTAFDRSLDAQDKKPVPDKKPAAAAADPQFAGKVLLVQKKMDQSPQVFDVQQFQMGLQGFLLEDAAVVEIAGTRFLAGHGIERVDGKPAGPRVMLAMENIGAILVFPSVEAFKAYEEEQTEKIQTRMQGMMGGINIMAAPAAAVPVDAPEERPDE
jgi:hypothetical protein